MHSKYSFIWFAILFIYRRFIRETTNTSTEISFSLLLELLYLQMSTRAWFVNFARMMIFRRKSLSYICFYGLARECECLDALLSVVLCQIRAFTILPNSSPYFLTFCLHIWNFCLVRVNHHEFDFNVISFHFVCLCGIKLSEHSIT